MTDWIDSHVGTACLTYLHRGRSDLTAEGVEHIDRSVHGEPLKGSLLYGACAMGIEDLEIRHLY